MESVFLTVAPGLRRRQPRRWPRLPAMATTLQQVAVRAGVSLATASRVLNGSARTPREDVAARVQQAAAELGYVANAQAQALARSSTGLIGLVVQDIADPYFSSIASGVQSVAQQHGRQMLLASTNRDPVTEHASVSAFMAYRTDAIILAGSRRTGTASGQDRLVQLCAAYARNGGTVAVIGQPVEDYICVEPNNASGATRLARELLAIGHRRFALITGQPWLRTSADRVAAFTGTVEQQPDARIEWSIATDFSRNGAYDAATARLADVATIAGPHGSSLPLCIFATTDVMALGVLTACRELGLDVPGQVAVAGFDDINTLRDSSPSLTTVRLDLEGMGRAAAQLVTRPTADLPRGFDADPILRESTRLS